MKEMETNLYDKIDDIYRRNDKWNYYGVNIIEPFDGNIAKELITQCFKKGEKKECNFTSNRQH